MLIRLPIFDYLISLPRGLQREAEGVHREVVGQAEGQITAIFHTKNSQTKNI